MNVTLSHRHYHHHAQIKKHMSLLSFGESIEKHKFQSSNPLRFFSLTLTLLLSLFYSFSFSLLPLRQAQKGWLKQNFSISLPRFFFFLFFSLLLSSGYHSWFIENKKSLIACALLQKFTSNWKRNFEAFHIILINISFQSKIKSNSLEIFSFVSVFRTSRITLMFVHHEMMFTARTIIGTILTWCTVGLTWNTCLVFVICKMERKWWIEKSISNGA